MRYSFLSPMEHFVFSQELTVNFGASIMCSDQLISDSVKLIPAVVSSTVAWNHDVLFIQTRGKESFLQLHRSDLYFYAREVKGAVVRTFGFSGTFSLSKHLYIGRGVLQAGAR